jgi:hypothetical protein
VTSYHPRSEWETAQQPVTGPAISWPSIVRIVIHYPGADFADLDFNNDGQVNGADSIQVLRQMQNQYLHKPKPYSLGYNWMVDTLGEVWEIRGFDIKCAANEEVNASSVAILLLVDDQGAANPAQIDATRWLVGQIRGRKPAVPIVTHASVATNSSHTPCPGAGITPQVHAGVFEPQHPVIIDPPVIIPPTSEEDDMLAQLLRLPNGDVVVRGAGPCRRVSLGGDIEHLVQTLGNPRNLTEADPETAWVRGELAAYDASVHPV